jgi:TrmH family RNA methyltransferase
MEDAHPLAAALAERLVVILVQPRSPGNVGATARAMKNTGLRRLRVVDPVAYDPEEARWMAPGCEDVLAEAEFVATFEEAVADCHRLVATTARHRRLGQPVWSPTQLAQGFLEGPPDEVVGLLFGREDIGLTNEEVGHAGALLRIPTPEHASLNLAQAVLLTGHELFRLAHAAGMPAGGRSLGGSRGSRKTAALDKPDARDQRAHLPDLEAAGAEVLELLDLVGYTRAARPEKVLATARQLLQEAGLSRRQVDALRGMVSRVRWALDHPGADWKMGRRGQAEPD